MRKRVQEEEEAFGYSYSLYEAYKLFICSWNLA